MNDHRVEEFEEFYKQFEVRSYKKGQMLIRADDDPQGIFCLTKGYIRQYTISKSGFELTLHILKPVSYFPLVWAINGTPNVYFFEALTTVEVRRAPREHVVEFIKDKSKIIFKLMSQLLEDYAETQTRMKHLVFSDAQRRVISILLYISKHFGEEVNGSTIIRHRFTQQDIATLVGVARETASNVLTKLEKEGLIKMVDHFMVFEDLNKLDVVLQTNNGK